MVMISSHRGSAEDGNGHENGRKALMSAVKSGVDYVEFDVQALADGEFILAHDPECVVAGRLVPWAHLTLEEVRLAEPDAVTLEEACSILAGRVKAHVDFKFDPAQPEWAGDPECESRACDILAEFFEPQDFIITTLEDASVVRVLAWAHERDIDILVGLSLGRSLQGRKWPDKLRVRFSEIFATKRLEACGANLVVAQKQLARLWLARLARKQGLPLLVWTVDADGELDYWLNHSSAWLVTTDFPHRARKIRRNVTSRPASN